MKRLLLLTLTFGFLGLWSIPGQAQVYSDTTSKTCISTAPDSLSFSINNVRPPASPGTITFYYEGDLNGSTEKFTLYDENGNNLGTNNSTTQCGPVDSTTFTVPVSTLSSWAADGSIDFGVKSASGVSATLCSPGSCVQLKIAYNPVSGPNDLGVSDILPVPNTTCPDTFQVEAVVTNFGTNQVDSFDLDWSVNGTPQGTINYVGTLDTLLGSGQSSDTIVLGNVPFFVGSTSITATSSNPNGVTDTVTINNSRTENLSPVIAPPGTQIVSFTNNSVLISNPDSLSSFQVEWGPCGFTQGTGTVDTLTNGSLNIMGLAGNTCYNVYIRKDCGNNFSDWAGPYTFTTRCNPFTAPYSNNFDNDSTGEIPICWNAYLVGSNTQFADVFVEQASTFEPANSAPNHVDFYNYNLDTTWLITPEFSDLPTGGNRVKFYAKSSSSATAGDLIVGTVSSPGNPSSFVAVDTIAVNDTYQNFIVPLDTANGYNGSHTFVVLAHAGGTFDNYYIDDFFYEAIPSCLASTNLTVETDSSTSSSLFVRWNSGQGVNYEVEWGPVGYTPGSSASLGSMMVPDTFATITGLSSQTGYDIYVRDSCTVSGFSPYAGPATGTTSCPTLLPISLPLNDGFENYSGPVTTTSSFHCGVTYSWSFENVSGVGELQFSYNPSSGPSAPNTGSQSSGLASLNSNSPVYMLFTGDFSNYVGGSSALKVSYFFADHFDETNAGDKVWVRGSKSDPWIEVLDWNQANATSAWAKDSFLLDGVLGANGQSLSSETQIRWGQQDNGSLTGGDGFSVDDLNIEEIQCPAPSNVGTSALADTSATLDWFDAGSAGTYEVWVGTAGFYQGSQTAGGTKVTTSVDSLNLDTLTANFCYDFLVRSYCGPGDTSTWVGPITFCTPCAGFNAPYTQNFDQTVDPAIDACWTPIVNGGGGFAAVETYTFTNNSAPNSVRMYNYQATASSGDIMLVSPLFNDLDSTKRVVFEVNSSTFNSSSLIVGTMSNPSDPATFSGYDTLPHSLIGTGNFTRQVISFDRYTGNNRYVAIRHGSQGTFDAIYVDDFVYEAIPSCPEPFSNSVLSVDSNSAEVTWDEAGTATNWQVEVGTGSLGSTGNTRSLVSNDTTTLTGLPSGTNQSFWVRAICGPGDTSQWTGPANFLTNCASKTARYIEDFDGQPTNVTPLCWSEYFRGGTSNFWAFEVYSFGTPYSGPNHVRFYNYNTDTAMGISPRFRDMDVGDKRFRFRAKTSSGTGTIYVGTVSDPADGSTFDPVDTISINANAYPEFTVELTTANGYNGTDEHLALYHGGGTFDTYYLDDFFYETIPSCIAPSGFSSSNLGQTSIDLDWQADTATASGDYVVQYGTSGVLNDPTNTITAVTGDSASITSLSSASGYCFWVASVCTPGDTSFYTGPICVTTKCFPTVAPYVETFDGATWVADDQDFSAVNSQIGACWSRFPDNGSDYSWRVRSTSTGSGSTGPDQDATGGNFVYTEASNGSSGDTTSLFSADVDLSNSTNPYLIYGYFFYGTSIDKMDVEINNGSGWTNLNTLTGQYQTSGTDPWQYDTISLSSYIGDTVQVRYTATSQGCCGGDMSLDDIYIGDLASCTGPSGVTAQGASTSSSTVSWSQDTATQSTILEYGPAGFTPGNGTTVTSTSTSYTLTGMSKNLCMDVYLRGVCSTGDTTFQQGPIKACPDEVTCDSLDQYSTSLSLAEQSALFIEWNGNGGDGDLSTNQASSGTQSLRIYDSGPAGFSDYVALFDTISSGAWEVKFDLYIESGKGGYFNIQQNYTGGTPANLWGGEIYFKDNGVAEVRTGTGLNLVGTFNYSQGQWITMSSFIDLDNDSVWFEVNGNSTGVGYIYSQVNGNPLQFNGVNFFSGVVSTGNYDIDYYMDNFCIEPYSRNCPAPTNLSTANAGCDSVEVSWTSNSGSSVIQYGPAGFTPGAGTFTGVVTSPHTITGLNPNTAYDVWVADTCGADTSMYTGPVSFTTANAPQPTASFVIDSAIVGNIEFYYLDASGSTDADTYQWNFGNGTTGSGMLDTIGYSTNGVYNITLIVSNACGSDTLTLPVDANVGLDENPLGQALSVFPNPTHGKLQVEIDLPKVSTVSLKLTDASGRAVLQRSEDAGGTTFRTELDLGNLSQGIYLLEIQSDGMTAHRRINVK